MRRRARSLVALLALLLSLAAAGCCAPHKSFLARLTPAGCDALKLHDLYQRVKCRRATVREAICLFRDLHERGRLTPAVERFVGDLVEYEGLARKYLEQAEPFAEMVATELCLRGIHPRCRDRAYEPWEEITKRHDALFAGADAAAGLEAEEARARIATLGGSRWIGGNTVQMLIDGPASWAKREEMLAGAKRRIDVLTWAFYDDRTGWDAACALLTKAKAGLQVRVVVDGRVASRAPYAAVVDYLEKRAFEQPEHGAGSLQVVRWRDAARLYDGQHRKIFLVDDTHLVAGGMNYGDWYSHQNPGEPQRWRDTDVYVRGPAAREAARLFETIWSERTGATPRALPEPDPGAADNDAEGVQVALVDHRSGADEHVLLSTIAAIEAARQSVDIETAYFVQMPSLLAALRRAIERGVRVRLLTNSRTSIDEPFIADAVATSARALAAAGGEVYLRRGSTLHSKFMVVDETFSSIGSYNLHPRSYRLEGEVMFHVLGTGPARELNQAFEQDLQYADRVRAGGPAEEPDALTLLALRFFPDQL